ncbi:MAG: hypothetical protein H0X27_00150 [Caulobacteraceae bacterium]|nr:hypothetical protein [Caulobacteraceae bacterium]
MNSWITNAKLLALGLFLAAALGMLGYDMIYVWPAQRCERGGDWWDPRDGQCLTPIPIWRITARALPKLPPEDAKP